MATAKSKQTLPTRPEELATILDVSPKQLRAFLRAEFPRPKEAKGTSWTLNEKMVSACVEHFSKDEA